MKEEKEPDDIKYSVGSLIVFKDLTKEQKDLFIKLISGEYSYLFQILYNVIDDDNKVLEILDIFEGQRFQFPSRKKLYKLLTRIKFYTYVKSRDYSEDAYKTLAKQNNMRISQIKSLVNRIDNILNNDTEDDK